MSIPNDAFKVRSDGKVAVLKMLNIPMPDTFFFGNNVSVAGEIDVNLRWRATAPPVQRGAGSSVPPGDFGAFSGEFSDARCLGTAGGRETGFHFRTDRLSEQGFFAEMGHERNGVFLEA